MNIKMIIKASFLLVLIFTQGTLIWADSESRVTPVVKVVQEAADSVVNISTERVILLRESPYWGNYGGEFDMFFDRFFGFYAPTRALKFKSVGSGVIVDKSGVIVTNSHVVNKASNIIVVFNDGSSVEGQLMYENPKDDIAIIKINYNKELKEAKLGSSDDLMIGESVVAIGNPLGLENSVTAGVISGKKRNFYDDDGQAVVEGLIQTDAPINPGNSGGALFNINKELIGINVAVVENSQSIGFAIPVEKVKEALKVYEENKNLPVRQLPKKNPTLRRQANPQLGRQYSNQRPEYFDPYQEMAKMRQEMDHMFQNYLGQTNNAPIKSPSGPAIFQSNNFFDPDIQIEDKGNIYSVTLDTKDLDKNKVNIDIAEDSLTISGEYTREVSQDNVGGSIKSHSYGSFLKTLPLPKDADSTKIKSEMKNDQLIVRIPKKKK